MLRVATALTLPALACGPGDHPPGKRRHPKSSAFDHNRSPTHGVLVLEPGFDPDPTTVTGAALGAVPASSLSRACAGWIPRAPSHVIDVRGPIPSLRLLVHGGPNDTVLALRKSDGQVRCNDDHTRRQPALTVDLPPGSHGLWVGTFTRKLKAPYTLTLTQDPALGTLSLQPPPVRLARDAK